MHCPICHQAMKPLKIGDVEIDVKVSLKEASEIFTNPKGLISEWRDLKAVLRMLRYRVFIENPKFRNILVGIQKSLPL